MNRPLSIIVFIYNSYKDPLFQNLLLSYIKTLGVKGNFRFELITFEQQQYQLSENEMSEEKVQLLDNNIHWYPRKFHTGRFLLIKKVIDVLSTFWIVTRINFKHHPKYIFAFANVSAAISVLFSKLYSIPQIVYSYEPHSEFLADLGLWKKSSLKFKILNNLEKYSGKNASHVMTGTKYGVEYLKRLKSTAKLYRAPTSVDPNDFYFRADSRNKIRKKLRVNDKDIYLYIGKFGDLYYTDQVAQIFGEIYQQNGHSFFCIVTTYDHQKVKNWLLDAGIPSDNFFVTGNLASLEIKEYISAADMGISAVPPTPSQKYRSPTKVAEYLLCGLPYITCKGVSEDDDYAIDHRVGVVLKKFSRQEIKKHYPRIRQLLDEEKEVIRERCRSTGLEYRSKKRIDDILETIFQ